MAFDEQIGMRIAMLLERSGVEFVEKRMFGGLGFMIDDKMSIGVVGDEIMLRCLPERYSKLLAEPNVREMDFTGRPMKGFVFVEPNGFETDTQLDHLVAIAVEFGKLGTVKKKKR